MKEKKYEVEKLTFPEKMVELEKETEERADREAAILKGIWKRQTPKASGAGLSVYPWKGT